MAVSGSRDTLRLKQDIIDMKQQQSGGFQFWQLASAHFRLFRPSSSTGFPFGDKMASGDPFLIL
jgi:hypothetical protein